MLGQPLVKDLPAWAGKYVNLPFKKYNCWQLICLIYKEQFDTIIPTYQNEYKNALDKRRIKEIYARELNIWTRVKRPRLGDVIVFNVNAQPWHAGLIISTKDMLHTEHKLESVIERYSGLIWRHRIVGYYQYVK